MGLRAMLSGLVVAVACALAAHTAAAQTPIFINELHYDNTGTDTGEAIEIAGPAGTDLTGWSLALYNGSGGAVYDTDPLPAGPIPDLCGGYGVVVMDYPTNGIQNGSPDGIALVDDMGTVVQFLSYEGTFTAADGPAVGMMSTDIGVVEPGDTPVGFSLQLAGTGLDYEDFTWSGPIANTFSVCNAGQIFAPAIAAPVINELVANHTGTDTNEYVEVFGDPSTSYSGYTILAIEGDSTGAGVIDLVVPVGTTDGSGFWFTGYLNNAIENGSMTLLLVEGFIGTVGEDLDTDNDGVLDSAPWTRIVDDVAISDGGSTDRAYSATVLAAGFDGMPFTPGGASRIPNGTDTDSIADWMRNDFDGEGLPGFTGSPAAGEAYNTPAAINEAVVEPAELVVNEIDYDQVGTDTAEFIEIYNPGSAPVNLGQFAIDLVNGNGGTVYNTISLPGVDLAAGDYFVVCGDAATVPECDLDVAPDTNLIQNGAPDAVAIVETASGDIVDAVSYEGDTANPYTEGSGTGLIDDPTIDFAGISRYPNGTDTNQNNVDLSLRCITPGGANVASSSDCLSPIVLTLAIHEIQGGGFSSPYQGSTVETLDNIVTAITSNGFFIQTPDASADGDSNTSEGIFVFTSGSTAVSVGDQVDVVGVVQEYFDQTEISGPVTVMVDSSGNPLPSQQLIDELLPSGNPADPPELERLEGMRVAAAGIASGPSDRFGDAPVVARSERSFREPGIEYPGLPGLPVWDGNPEIFELDPDGLGLPDLAMFTGQTFDAEGVLAYAFGMYQLLPETLVVGPVPDVLRPVTPKAIGQFTIASQNLLRLEAADPSLALRLAKLSWHIRETLGAPDIVAVQEVDTLVTLGLLADQIAADDPALAYTPYLLEGNDISGIDVGFLVLDTISVHSVTQLGLDETFTFEDQEYLTFDRPPLVLDADYIGAGEPFPVTVIANHLRSLGGIETDDFPRVKRFEQALRLSEYIQTLQGANPALRLVVTGDFNSFQFTDGYVDVMGQITGNLDPLGALLPGTDVVEPDLLNEIFALADAERYSYVFDGNAQGFDYMLTSEGIAPFVVGGVYSRGNADAPAALLLDGSTPMRVSDHDAVVLYLFNDADLDGVPNELDVCPDTVIPEGVPTIRLESNRWALVDDDGIFDTTRPPGQGGGLDREFTIEDTAGCSCEQIIEELHLGRGLIKFGCTTGAMESWILQLEP